MVNILIKGRDSAKTVELLYTSEATGYPIVVSTTAQVEKLIEKARALNLNIPNPYTVDEMRNAKSKTPCLIDDGDKIINDALEEYLGNKVISIALSQLNIPNVYAVDSPNYDVNKIKCDFSKDVEIKDEVEDELRNEIKDIL